MSAKHTPGPWLFRNKDSSIRRTSETHPYGGQIARFDEDDDGHAVVSEEDLDLILAAPDLLAACERALLALLQGNSEAAREEMEAAIAKAKGGGA